MISIHIDRKAKCQKSVSKKALKRFFGFIFEVRSMLFLIHCLGIICASLAAFVWVYPSKWLTGSSNTGLIWIIQAVVVPIAAESGGDAVSVSAGKVLVVAGDWLYVERREKKHNRYKIAPDWFFLQRYTPAKHTSPWCSHRPNSPRLEISC